MAFCVLVKKWVGIFQTPKLFANLSFTQVEADKVFQASCPPVLLVFILTSPYLTKPFNADQRSSPNLSCCWAERGDPLKEACVGAALSLPIFAFTVVSFDSQLRPSVVIIPPTNSNSKQVLILLCVLSTAVLGQSIITRVSMYRKSAWFLNWL